MTTDKKIPDTSGTPSKITVIGAGAIGLSWTGLFLANGWQVTINDPREDIKAAALEGLARIKPSLAALGYSVSNFEKRLSFEPDLEKAVKDADIIQENGPENLAFKQDLYEKLDKWAKPTALLLSSSSSIPASVFSVKMTKPERALIGHPFNPPHLIPLVEVVPGKNTSHTATTNAMDFYRSLGKRPVLIEKEIAGFVANRLQAAMMRESVHLVREGVITMEGLDSIVSSSIGLRWAAAGPFKTFTLGGGSGGFRHFLEGLGPMLEKLMMNIGDAHFDAETTKVLLQQYDGSYGKIPITELEQQRDHQQLAIMKALGKPSQPRLIVLDGMKGKMHVFDTEGNLLRTLVEATGGTPDGVAVDHFKRQIYWTNMGEHFDQADGFIERIDFDGSNRTLIIPKGGTTTAKQLELDVVNKLIYWCDREGMRVMRSNMDGSAICSLIVAGFGKEDQKDETNHCVGIAIDHRRRQMYWTQKGAPNSGTGRILRAGLDLPNGEGPVNRTDIDVVLDHLPEPIDLEIEDDGDWLYWTDRGDPPKGNTLNRVYIADDRNSNEGVEILDGNLKEGIGLALDKENNRAFVTDLGGNIYQFSLDGMERKLLYAGKDGQGFTGIAYVPEGLE
jgi:3-hydroxyacyl-CoA dehydrogenase